MNHVHVIQQHQRSEQDEKRTRQPTVSPWRTLSVPIDPLLDFILDLLLETQSISPDIAIPILLPDRLR
jgi:hypothetical protein